MPLPHLTVLDDTAAILAEHIKLYVPSELTASDRVKSCLSSLPVIEERVREAATRDALQELRHHLCTQIYLNKWRVKNVSGQRTSTHVRSLQHHIDIKVHDAKSHYRRSRKMLLHLRGPGLWERALKELKDEDVRALNERTLSEREQLQREHRIRTGTQYDKDAHAGVILAGLLGEGKRKLSWIWMSAVGEEDSPEMIDGTSFLTFKLSFIYLFASTLCRVG